MLQCGANSFDTPVQLIEYLLLEQNHLASLLSERSRPSRRDMATDLPPFSKSDGGISIDGDRECSAKVEVALFAGGSDSSTRAPNNGLPSAPTSVSHLRMALRFAPERSRVTGITFGSLSSKLKAMRRSCRLRCAQMSS